MRKIWRFLAVALFIGLTPGMTIAEEPVKSYANACTIGEGAFKHLGTAGCVILGFLGGFGGHEFGHYLLSGGDIKFHYHNDGHGLRDMRWRCPGCSRGRIQAIARGGFIEQIISTEFLLGFKDIPREHPLIAGFLAWNILNPIVYTIRAETGHCETNCDLRHFDRDNRRIIETIIVAHAVFSAYRLFFKDDRFPLLFTSTGKNISLLFEHKF